MKKLSCLLFISFLTISNLFAVDFYEIERSTVGNSTLSDIRDLVRNRVDDPSTSYGDPRYTNALINEFINEGQRDVTINTNCLWSSCTGFTVADQAEYDLLTNIWAIDRVVWNDDYILGPKDIYEMDADNASWFDTDASSSTAYYWYRGMPDKIYFFPTPENSTGTLKIWYIKLPENMTSDSDEIFDSNAKLEAFKESLVHYATYRIFFLEGDPRSQTAWQEYNAYLGVIKKTWDIQPNYKPSLRLWRE